MSFAKSAIQVSTQTIEGKYATALYRAANRQSTIRQVESDIARLKTQLDLDGSKISAMLGSPLYSNSQKSKLVMPLVSKFDQSGTVHKFIDVLTANGRLAKLSQIVDSFIQICESQKQCSNVTVTAAKELTKTEQDRLIAAVSNRFGQSGKMLKFTFKVENILGGFIIEIDDKLIDLSVKSKLSTIIKDQ